MLPAETDIADGSDRPDIGRPALGNMREACDLPDTLFGGNRAMRKRSETYLPKEEKETDANWKIRISRSTVFPFYRDTLCDLAARPFGREIAWEDAEPGPKFTEFLRDMDGTGKSLTVFARDTLLNAMHRGMDHVLVNTEAIGTGENDQLSRNRRVYAKRIDALSMLDIRDAIDETGRKRVTYCRFVTCRVVKSDDWQQESEVVIVELDKGITIKGKEAGSGWRREWTFDRESRKWMGGPKTSFEPGNRGIPLFTIYTQQTGPYAAEPVMEDLAWVNLAHYQSRSDHAHVMRIARLITLVTLGWKDRNPGDPMAKSEPTPTLGPLSRISNADPDAKTFFLEPSGKSIELSFQDMAHLADECKRLGARHEAGKTGNVTARAVTVDDAKSVTNLQMFCVRLDVLLWQVIDAFAEWVKGVEMPEGLQPRVNKEFTAGGNIEGGARALMAIKDALTTRQLIIEAIRYGILRPDFPIDENLEELEKQRAAIDDAIARAAGAADQDDDLDLDDEGDDDSAAA